MKKITAIVLSLVLVLAMVCTASAEVRSFAMAGVTDLDGNAMEVEELPEAILTIDDSDAHVCSYTTAEETADGTYEILEENAEEGYVVLTCTFPEDVITFMYYAEADACYLVDEENSVIYIFVGVTE